MQESRLKWNGHVLRREDEYVGKRVMVMEVPGNRRRGRPKRRWLDNIKNNFSERELSGEAAQDRVQWRRLNHQPHIKVGKDAEEEEEDPWYDAVIFFATDDLSIECIPNTVVQN